MSARSRTDDGTVLLLILGLVTVAALLVGVVTDVSALYLERRKLISAADGAALAGAQEVDKATVYTQGLPREGPVALDAQGAEHAARQYLADTGMDLADVRVSATATTVTVSLQSRYELPIASRVTAGASGTADVAASATAQTAVIP